MSETLRTFQRKFVRNATASGIDVAALSIPRGNGKSFLAGHILSRALTPGDPLFEAGTEYLLGAASLEQARLCFRFVRSELEPRGGYRFLDSNTRIGITHKPTNTRLRVLSSNAKSAFGIVGTRLAVLDEPGSFEVIGGQLLADAVLTALGKPGSPMRIIFIGTLAPALSGWWHDLIDDGSQGSTYVQKLQGDRETWDNWNTIRKANPLTAISPEFRAKLLQERDAARREPRLKARFLSYRLNLPSADESEMLLTVEDWDRLKAREVPDRQGAPIVAVDLGAGRAWSAAVAIWQGGRVEALAVAPGIPGLDEQERRDRVPSGTYRTLAQSGLLGIAADLEVQPPSMLWDAVRERWGVPASVVCDFFRLPDLRDAVKGACPIEPRRSRWSEASADIRALRSYAKDGPLAVAESDRMLLAASLAVTQVKNDDSGSTRIVKSPNNTARDDVAAALTLAGGAYQRAERQAVPAGPGYVVI